MGGTRVKILNSFKFEIFIVLDAVINEGIRTNFSIEKEGILRLYIDFMFNRLMLINIIEFTFLVI
jgi:hypothetical protein